MLEFFVAYTIGMALGLEPSGQVADADGPATTVVAPAEVAEAAEAGSAAETEEAYVEGPTVGFGEDELADGAREPEPQVATGKYTTAVEVRPILGLTKSNWVAVRNYQGQDLVYFTHLLSWRCGLWEIRYGINGAPASEVFPMEPCNEQFSTPNAMVDVENFLPYTIFPDGSVESLYVEITYDDGTVDFARFNRSDVLIP